MEANTIQTKQRKPRSGGLTPRTKRALAEMVQFGLTCKEAAQRYSLSATWLSKARNRADGKAYIAKVESMAEALLVQGMVTKSLNAA